MKQESKDDLYHERVRNDNHREELFIEPEFFRNLGCERGEEKGRLRYILKDFNRIVERETGGIEYSVTLRYGISKMAADFDYQFMMFKQYIRNNGLIEEELNAEFRHYDILGLKGALTYKQATGKFTLSKSTFETISKAHTGIKTSEMLLLILYKAFSNKPNQLYPDDSNGRTGLSDARAAEMLGCSAKTIQRARIKLTDRGLVTELAFNGRHRKLRVKI